MEHSLSASILAIVIGLQAAGSVASQDAAPPALGKAATEAVAARFAGIDNWVQQSVTLLSLNHYWHPVGVPIVIQALKDSDRRLQAYGIETLLRGEAGLLPSLATQDLMEQLIRKQLGRKNKYYHGRVLTLLSRLAPKASAKTKNQWRSWWSKAKKEWAPQPWQPKPVPKHDPKRGGATVSQSFGTRALDIYQYGLDVAICIDATGSMQRTIDASRDAVGGMLEILKGISPKLRMGLVQYRDMADMKGGAELLAPLSANVKSVRERLSKLRAMGGGDAPERVAEGLQICLSSKMRWKKKANKLVIIIGDAPPKDLPKALRLAKSGYENPGGRRKVPVTGPKRKKNLRPIITSAIAVNGGSTATFRQIAAAGHGAFAQIIVGAGAPPGRGPAGGGRPAGRGGAAPAKTPSPTRAIVENILVLSFGSSFRSQMRVFVAIYFSYRDGGWIRGR